MGIIRVNFKAFDSILTSVDLWILIERLLFYVARESLIIGRRHCWTTCIERLQNWGGVSTHMVFGQEGVFIVPYCCDTGPLGFFLFLSEISPFI